MYFNEDGFRNVMITVFLFLYTLSIILVKPYKSKPLNNLALTSSSI